MYELKAVIAEEAVLRDLTRGLPVARAASVGQGLWLMPMTNAVLDAVTDGGGERVPGFRRLPAGFEKALAACSAAGPAAYVEAEYFGGAGEQHAVVWEGGAVVLGPLHLDEGEPFPPAGSPVSRALRRLGVAAGAGEDEFSAVGLGRHRRGEEWIA
ncbi:hypothetical protein ACWCPM_01925 [Streptomyces sp. NPDC002309]